MNAKGRNQVTFQRFRMVSLDRTVEGIEIEETKQK